MTLDEIAAAAPQALPLAVPAWTLGCFHRRCITYATGVEDTATTVIWLQSHGLTADLRIAAHRPDVSHRHGLGDCTREELIALAEAEGGVADTAFADNHMSWGKWAAFQPYDKWPEPGELRRIGDCLVEFAPTGVYVEDWRLQRGSGGLRVGLRLVSENGKPRDGGLVVTGDHAMLALDRRAALPNDEPCPVQMREAKDPAALAVRMFDARTSYARRSGDGWRVELSTDPFAQGLALDLGRFEPADQGCLTQDVETPEGAVRRLWRVDTLLTGQAVAAPAAAAEGLAWLDREGPRLPGVR